MNVLRFKVYKKLIPNIM